MRDVGHQKAAAQRDAAQKGVGQQQDSAQRSAAKHLIRTGHGTRTFFQQQVAMIK